jgi:hypothetical protein
MRVVAYITLLRTIITVGKKDVSSSLNGEYCFDLGSQRNDKSRPASIESQQKGLSGAGNS